MIPRHELIVLITPVNLDVLTMSKNNLRRYKQLMKERPKNQIFYSSNTNKQQQLDNSPQAIVGVLRACGSLRSRPLLLISDSECLLPLQQILVHLL